MFHQRVLDGVRRFLEDHAMAGKTGPRDFYDFEKALHERLLEAEREIVTDVMAASDVEADAIEIEGRVHRRVLKSAQTYMTAWGEVVVERWLYKERADPTAHALAALDLRLGFVDGFWTQRAAEHASWVVTQMTPQKAQKLFERVGNMEPSKSSLDRLPKALGERWDGGRDALEQVLRDAIVLPEGATTIAVSIDGILAPIDGGNSPSDVRRTAGSEGRLSKGPAGYREVGCATLAFCDDKGDLISAIRSGRGAEPKKLTLKDTLRKDLAHGSRASRPAARKDHRRWRRQLGVPGDAARGPGDPGLLPCDRAPPERHRRGARRRSPSRHGTSSRSCAIACSPRTTAPLPSSTPSRTCIASDSS